MAFKKQELEIGAIKKIAPISSSYFKKVECILNALSQYLDISEAFTFVCLFPSSFDSVTGRSKIWFLKVTNAPLFKKTIARPLFCLVPRVS